MPRRRLFEAMDKNQPLILLAAGGTGGHLFPAEALGVELIKRGRRVARLRVESGRVKTRPGPPIRTSFGPWSDPSRPCRRSESSRALRPSGYGHRASS